MMHTLTQTLTIVWLASCLGRALGTGGVQEQTADRL